MVRVGLASTFAVLAAARSKFYNQGPTGTRLGCECKSPCQTDWKFECNVAEFCEVTSSHCSDGTAPWSLTHGHYDWCTYGPYESYESKSAQAKQSMLLQEAAKGGKGAYPGALSLLSNLVSESVMTTFIGNADVFPNQDGKQRVKIIHSVGVVGGIRFDSNNNHPYKGLFEGAANGVVRFSSATEPGKGGVAPGMGLKFLRDGRESANFPAMYALDGQPCTDTNFFQHEWSNHVPPAGGLALDFVTKKFWQGSYCPQMVGVSDMASPSKGVPAKRGTFPYQLFFKPKVSVACDCMNYDKCLSNFASIKPGTELFEVEAIASPGATRHAIGTLTLTEALSTSKFGDEELFFQHQHMEDDFAIHPEWLRDINLAKQCGMSVASGTVPAIEQGCSSPFNSTMLFTDTIV